MPSPQAGHPISTWAFAPASGGIVNTSDNAAAAAPGASIRNFVTSMQCVNQHATVSTEVVIKSNATVIWRGYFQAVSVGGTVCMNFDPPLKGGVNEAINVACITTGAAVYPNIQGFVSRES